MSEKSKDLIKFVEPYRVTSGKHWQLKDCDPADTGGLDSEMKGRAPELLQASIEALSDLQDKLYAQDRWSVLIIFQAIDAAGKDSTIKHVMSGVNPQGCQVVSFKQPSFEELDHDFLWRCTRALPQRGHIGIFNRSYYEEVLTVRVHTELLKAQRIPDTLITDDLWKERFEDINALERHLARNGTVILKFFLNLSKGEQKKRFLSRLEEPRKNWKFSPTDVHEREFWDEYQSAFENMVRNTSSPHAPWYVVPADNKWFTRLVVSSAIVEAMRELHLDYPVIDDAKKKQFEEARVKLLANNGKKK